MSRFYLGIDGGGTKTRATILNADGYVVGVGVGDSSNINNIGKAQATAHIDDAVTKAATQAGMSTSVFDAVFLGIAGVVSKEDHKNVLEIANALNLAVPAMIAVDHDCRIALAGGLAGQPGIVQIIGTGTACFGMNRAGKRWLSGGWGYLIADEGGGYWLGIQAIKAAAEYADGRGQATMLKDMLCEKFNIGTLREIMHLLYTQNQSVSEIAALSHMVINAATQKDAVAQNIIECGMAEVARCVAAVADALGFVENDSNVVVVGGMTQAGDIITHALKQAVQRRLPLYNLVTPQFDAALGAALLARQQHVGNITPAFIENVRKTAKESV